MKKADEEKAVAHLRAAGWDEKVSANRWRWHRPKECPGIYYTLQGALEYQQTIDKARKATEK